MIEKTSRLLRVSSIPMIKLIDPKILSFGVVGVVGFVVDAFLLTLLTIQFGLNVLPSRAGSFACATVVTWLLNRMFTFSRQVNQEPQARKKEYFLYLAVQVIGAVLNFVVFFALIVWNPVLREMPIIPLAGGAIIALAFNFTMSRKFVFKNSGGLNE